MDDDQLITWGLLTRIEPRLMDMENRLKAIKDTGETASFCANVVWYGSGKIYNHSYRNEMQGLVGWKADSQDERIRTQKAYDLAYKHLYNLLPDCRGCSCF